MTVLISVIETALPVLAALFLGMFCRKTGFLRPEGIEALKKVALNICLPATLVNAFATMAYTPSSLLIPVMMFLLCGVGLGIGMLLAKWMKLDRITAYLATGFEAGMLGYTLFSLLYPTQPAAEFAILDPGHTLFIFTIYKLSLRGKGAGRSVLREIAASPVIWAVAIGMLLGISGLYGAMASSGLSGPWDAVVSFLSAPTGMMILLCIGYDLDLRQLRWREISRLILLRLLSVSAVLALLLGLSKLLGIAIHTGAAVLFFLLPPCYVLPIFADDEAQRATLSSATSALTLVTLVLFAIMAVVIHAGF